MIEYPLTAPQARLRVLAALDPESGAYNMIWLRRIRGCLDTAVLEAALSALSGRHDSLRTRFPLDRSVGLVEDRAGIALERVDVAGEAELQRSLIDVYPLPFDLPARPPVRYLLYRLAPEEHVLAIVLHHIVADGWSLSVIAHDLAELYEAGLEGRPPAFAEPPPSFAAHARAVAKSGEDDVRTGYWTRQLAGALPPDLPADAPGRAPGSGSHVEWVSPELSEALAALGRERRVTLYMVLLAAFQILLGRHGDSDDVWVATLRAARDSVELEGVVGYLLDTLLLHGDLSGDPAFGELLSRTRQTVLTAQANGDVPFERIRGAADPDASLVQAVFILQTDMEGGAHDFGGLELEEVETKVESARAKFPLALEAWPAADGIELIFSYDRERFETSTIARIAARLVTLLGSIAASPDAPLSELELLPATELAELERLGAGPPSGPGVAAPLPIALADQAAATPHATAVVQGERSITYAELDAEATRLARRLRALSSGDGAPVGICLPRSPEQIMAMLGIWKAGRAYAPLDADHPPARLAELIADAGIRAVVADDRSAPELPATVTRLDPLDRADVEGEAQLPEVALTDPAYVIHTSGSTGRPKGVVVSHRALALRIAWMREAYALAPGDRVLRFASLSFDTSLEEIMPALTSGATLVISPLPSEQTPDFLAGEGSDVTVLDLPTSYWHELVTLGDVRPGIWPPQLRLVIIGADQANASAVERWRERFGDRVELINSYGPTEATIIATAGRLGQVDATRRPSLGRPIAATTVELRDSVGRLVPVGVSGEINVCGSAIADGYLGDADLTRARFGGGRYRTGDRGRWLADGTLEFGGRIDDQVKIRGHRVEPGEIEARLRACAGVVEAAVIVADQRLVAHVVAPADGDGDSASLERELGAMLPAHMVPASYEWHDRLPLTPNGKLDRVALAVHVGRARGSEHVEPATDAQRLVAGVWAELLGVERVGVDDDFFALGGQSLLAMRVAARLSAAVEVELPLRTIFDRRTVAALAAAVEELVLAEVDALDETEVEELLARDTESA